MTDLDKELSAIEERVKAATDGPWEFEDEDSNQMVVAVVKKDKRGREHDKIKPICALAGLFAMTPEFTFIAHSRTDVPRLLAALRKCIEQRDENIRTRIRNMDERYHGETGLLKSEYDQELAAILRGGES